MPVEVDSIGNSVENSLGKPVENCSDCAQQNDASKLSKLSQSAENGRNTLRDHDGGSLHVGDTLKFGDHVKLWTTSYYVKQGRSTKGLGDDTESQGGYIGIYTKRDVSRVAVPPIGKSGDGVFSESVFVVVNADKSRCSNDVVRYGDFLLLIDVNGLVWNSKAQVGSMHFFDDMYVYPEIRGSSGDLLVSFFKQGHIGDPVLYRDPAVSIDVRLSNDIQSNTTRLTNSKSSFSNVIGGYLSCDTSGHELFVCIHPCEDAEQLVSPFNRVNISSMSSDEGSSFDLSKYFSLPVIDSLAIHRQLFSGEIQPDVMIKNPCYGSAIKLFDIRSADTIVISLDKCGFLARIPVDTVFTLIEEAAASAARKLSDNIPCGPIRLEVAVVSQSEADSDELSTNGPNSLKQKPKLDSIELFVERDLKRLTEAFGEKHTDCGMRSDYEYDEEEHSTIKRIGLLNAIQKLLISYFVLAIALPSMARKFLVVFLGYLSQPPLNSISGAADETPNTGFSVDHLQRYESIFSRSHVDTIKADLSISFAALLVCFLVGFVTPSVLIEGKHSMHEKHRKNRNNVKDMAMNLIVSVSVPMSWCRQVAAETALGKGSTDTENAQICTNFQSNDSESSQQKQVYLGVWGEVGVDENGRPKHPAFERFLLAEKSDMENALKRWAATCAWRHQEGVDKILDAPHPNFDILRQALGSYFCCRDKQGSVVCVEQPGFMNASLLKTAGIELDELVHHFIYTSEMMWRIFEPAEDAKTVSIIDLEGIGMFDFKGQVIDYVKKTISISGSHYPERAKKVFIVNAPRFFSMVWSVVKPWIDDVTKAKVSINGNYQLELLKLVDADQLPVRYGGNNVTSLRESPFEKFIDSFVCLKLLESNASMRPSPEPTEAQQVSFEERIDRDLLKEFLDKVS